MILLASNSTFWLANTSNLSLPSGLERERKLEEEISELTRGLARIERTAEERERQVEAQQAAARELEAACAALRQELLDYKLRAKKVLKQHEDTIHQLQDKLQKQSSSRDEDTIDQSDVSGMFLFCISQCYSS